MGQSMSFPDGTYRIKNLRAGTYMTCSAEDPINVYGWASRPHCSFQRWELKAVQDGCQLRNVGTGRYLSVNNTTNGTTLRATTDNPTPWSLDEVGESGTWCIRVAGTSSSVADLHEGRNANGVSINLWPRIGDARPHQRWKLKRISDESAEEMSLDHLPSGKQV